MYSRVTLVEVDTMRTGMDDALALFTERVFPALREQDGYEGVLVLTTPEGKGMILSFWEAEESADAASAFAVGELERYLTLFRSPPGREHYEVAFAELPVVA
jgi:hypothetical protein